MNFPQTKDGFYFLGLGDFFIVESLQFASPAIS